MGTKEHWEKVFATKRENEVSWFQPYPATSMAFVDEFGLKAGSAIIDIGGGDSRFAEALIQKGFSNVHVLDISSNAIARARERLGEKASLVRWIVSDVTEFDPEKQYDFWHDRAAFHFLTSEESIKKYLEVAARAVKPGGFLVLGTFSENGPQKCSGLEIRQYNEAKLRSLFEKAFQPVRCFTEEHTTPSGATQDFQFCSFQRK